jgi:hypothetical protein
LYLLQVTDSAGDAPLRWSETTLVVRRGRRAESRWESEA